MEYSKEHQAAITKLSQTERLVFNELLKGDVNTNDISKIASECRLTDLQVTVAMQLLAYKQLIPSET